MASSDINIVNISNLEKIESFLNDSAYKEIIENSETFNTRLCIERRLRMPFLDAQTGVAQNNCSLFMKKCQRMPGLKEGQLVTYPSARWRKTRRQYLIQQHHRPFGRFRDPEYESVDSFSNMGMSGIHSMDGSSLGAGGDTDSKDSHKDVEPPKEWFYDEMDIHDMESFEDPEQDSDFDYEEPYHHRRRKRGGSGGGGGGGSTSRNSNSGAGSRGRGFNMNNSLDHTPSKRGRGGGRGRGRKNQLQMDFLNSSGSSTNENRILDNSPLANLKRSGSGSGGQRPLIPQHLVPHTSTSPLSNIMSMNDEPPVPVHIIPVPDSKLQQISAEEQKERDLKHGLKSSDKPKAAPSPYCDFCLGNQRENKKTGIPEELISCSDCGRSGHPTCLQFTTNMIISVRKYRWQCIECKYCSICGTSDNDDKLLFCDDCDRGYHMYCLSPPLTNPPEGSWSCKLCNEEFHSNKK